MDGMLFQGWEGIFRVILVALLAYTGLVALLRISGKRTLAKLNAFDLVVTVAMGSILATVLLSRDVALFEGIVAFASLIALQFVVAWMSVRSETLAGLVRSEATLLVRDGALCRDTMKRERVTEAEVLTVIRQSAANNLDNVTAVILETDGSFSVIGRTNEDEARQFARAGLHDAGT